MKGHFNAFITWKNSGIYFFGHNPDTYCQHYGIGMLQIQNGLQNGYQIYDFKQKCSGGAIYNNCFAKHSFTKKKKALTLV